MSEMKQVKVDNWGIYFLQRLKHFFNRTDYCDLTLQFQDNAQLKVHRLVLNACTEYFELLERTCEMYEDCLIMPDDLQAEVVVPIVNFMYTGQLEFEMDLLEKLFQTSQIMNIQVLSKLLDAQRHQSKSRQVNPSYLPPPKQSCYSRNSKRPYPKALESMPQPPEKKAHSSTFVPSKKPAQQPPRRPEKPKPVTHSNTVLVQRPQRKVIKTEFHDPRPTRYEVPEELDNDNIYDDSFMNISYDSKPLMIHPETTKRFQSKKPGFALFSEATSSKKSQNTSLEVECRKISTNESIFEDDISNDSHYLNKTREVVVKSDPGLLFDQVIENSAGPKMVIETKDSQQGSNIDHAKIISEVLKKYPHLVNSNKNIKLKILDNPQTKPLKKPQRKKESTQRYNWGQTDPLEIMRVKEEQLDTTYEDVHNSKEAARLIALGAENINGPWICLICGTPGKALHFPTYYKFRRHLVEVHHEKPIPNICEYCGLKSGKRNYLLHHMYTKHDIPPPANYHFPKCNQCSYIALTEAFLVKHKASHAEQRDFRCNVCFIGFKTSTLLLRHIQATGHKFTAERKANLQCIYCQRVFLREGNLFAHLKTSHKAMAKRDGIVEDSDEEEPSNVKFEVPVLYEPEDDENVNEMQYQIQSRPDGNIQVTRSPAQPRQTILNTGLKQTKTPQRSRTPVHVDTTEEADLSPKTMNLNEEMMISEQEFLNVNPAEQDSDQYYMPSMEQAEPEPSLPMLPKTGVSYMNSNKQQQVARHAKPLKKSVNTNEVIEIVMPSEHEMASDPPVIFDSDGNPGKTLAVLTTLDNTNEDMMILPDDGYSINVTQGDDTTNQNIVVVYSHEGDISKPYLMEPQYAQSQMITTQSAQFVQAPAIITPNYIMTTSSEIISQASPQVYQENIEQPLEEGQDTLEEQNVLQKQFHAEQTIVTSVDDTANLDNQGLVSEKEQVEETDISNVAVEGTELQEQTVALAESPTYTHQDIEMEDEQSVILSHDVGQQIQFVEEQTSTLEEANDKVNEVEKFIETQPELTSEGEYMVHETELHQEQDIAFDTGDHNKVTEPNIEETSDAMEIAEETGENEPTESVPEEDTVIEATTVVQPATIEPPMQSKPQIQSLASEWSEDEEDNSAAEKDPETVVNPEVEESIENIQQEMQKAAAGVDTEDETEPETQELPQGDQEQPDAPLADPASNGVVEAPQEKISSLLNDWDDNDSQEESDPTNNANEAPIHEELPEQKSNNTEESSAVLDGEDPNKIPLKVVKSLVSDWDDEEEESKE